MFKDFLADVYSFLKPYDFKKSGSTFYFNQNQNTALINFQKSVSNSKDILSFTINLGISSNIIRNFDQRFMSAKPIIDLCHWKCRIGSLLPDKRDKWWELRDSNFSQILDETRLLLISKGIPEINKYITDELLIHSWLNNISSGLTEVEMLINLSILLKYYKRGDELNRIIEKLLIISIGKPYESMINYHIDKLIHDLDTFS